MSDISEVNTNKRKIEDVENGDVVSNDSNEESEVQSNKRVALDVEQLQKEKEEVEPQTAPAISSVSNEDSAKKQVKFSEEEEKPVKKGVKFAEDEEVQPVKKGVKFAEDEEVQPIKKGVKFAEEDEEVLPARKGVKFAEDEEEEEDHEEEPEAQKPIDEPKVSFQEAPLETYTSEPQTYENPARSVSSYKDKEESNVIQLRMYCAVKEASTIVGKKGETITHIRKKADVKIQVSENLTGVPERIVSIKGLSENVARAIGLIVRTLLDEPEDEPATIDSKLYNLKLLIPHPMIGFIIGKQGSKFREIENNSASNLKAGESSLAYSTDRILSVQGVADAIHIAVYYIAQVMIEHRDALKKHKIVLYNPANYQHNQTPSSPMNPTAPISLASAPSFNSNPLPYQSINPQQQQQPYGATPYGQASVPQQSYNFNGMFQPAVQPAAQYSSIPPPQQQQQQQQQQSMMAQPPVPSSVPQQNQFIDEFGNNTIGEVIVKPAVAVGGGKYNQDVYVANTSIGSVIGKGGNNIKHIRTNSGCSYVDIEPDMGQSIMVGGRGMVNIRKLTLTGTMESFQMAIYLINQRINADRERNSR